MHILWKIGGEAGFGIMTTGPTFARIAARSGYHVFDYNEYPSLIRGGHNTFEVLVSDEPVNASRKHVDILVCLNHETFELHKERLSSESIVVFDPDDFQPDQNVRKVEIPFARILREAKAKYVMANTLALGASLTLLGGDMNILRNIIETEFKRKGEEVVRYNITFADRAANIVKEQYSEFVSNKLTPQKKSEKIVVSGNDGFALGSLIADSRFYCAYPMTPSSQVLATLASWQAVSGIVVRHAEDEISVINTAIGTSFGGIRSAVGTSGGGFALMVESVSFAGVAEIGIVIFLGMRPGPATGMPTWTEQGDLLFAVHAGHGEFPKIILAPGDMQEMIEMTAKAHNLADIYQTPVIVVSDKFLCEAHSDINRETIARFTENFKVMRGKTTVATEKQDYQRYEVTDDGISERLLPGQEGIYYQANSYEHSVTGHSSDEASDRVAQVDKRQRKLDTYLRDDYQGPRIFGNLEQSDTIFVSWGANKGPIIDAQRILQERGIQTAYVHFTHVFPLIKAGIPDLTQTGKRYILVENNSQAQFGRLLRQETGITIDEKLLKYDGRPFWPEEIVDYVVENQPNF